jgi:hypothetical protein
MNTQRWLTLGIAVGLVALCITLSMAREEPEVTEGTPMPTATLTPTTAAETTETVVPTITPLIFVGAGTPTPIGDEPYVILSGDFVAPDPVYRGSGRASIYQVGDTRRVLRLDPFEVTEGPELHVLLSEPSEPRTSAEVMLPTYVDLGALVTTAGSQNNEIPETVDLSRYHSVVIYSTPFNIVYLTAALTGVRGQ